MLFFKLILFLSLFAGASILPVSNSNFKVPVKWEVQQSSTLGIEGQSNINKFRCDIGTYDKTDTIIGYEDITSKPIKLRGSLKINLSAFNCHSQLITNDMRKTLKAEEYPRLVIHFISLDRIPVLDRNADTVKGWVNIELAGVTKSFEILYSFTQPDSTGIILDGGRNFNFSDFKVKPPRKLAGIIQIRDAFSVNFRLVLRSF